MPHSLSAKKRVRQTAKRRMRNRTIKSAVKTRIRKAETALAAGDAEAARTACTAAIRAIDKAVTKGVLHRNTAARRKSRLATRLNALAAGPPEG
jgi:small subunit ribosomal protein S20